MTWRIKPFSSEIIFFKKFHHRKPVFEVFLFFFCRCCTKSERSGESTGIYSLPLQLQTKAIQVNSAQRSTQRKAWKRPRSYWNTALFTSNSPLISMSENLFCLLKGLSFKSMISNNTIIEKQEFLKSTQHTKQSLRIVTFASGAWWWLSQRINLPSIVRMISAPSHRISVDSVNW